ncbi:MAG: DegT/DnrJ/EryC1/StrS family aminotransferase [Gemmatimonadales bacterium]
MADWLIPLFDLDYGEAEASAVSEVFKSQWLTMGERIIEFEREFAQLCAVRHAIAMNNCTAALHASYVAAGVRPGDEVIVPSLTFVATVNTVISAGALPVFADIANACDLSISRESIERAITPRTRAIAVLHYGGFACAIAEIRELADSRGLALIEDCAHAPGSSSHGRMLGAWGDAAAFSFFSNKNLSTGEGGMVTTNDDDLAVRLRLLRSHGMTTMTLDRHRGHAFSYDVTLAGHNYRMDEMHAALGSVQLDKLRAKNARRRLVTAHYREKLSSDLPEVGIPFPVVDLEQSACHIMAVVLPENVEREPVMKAMARQRIQSSVHYPPVHHFSYYRERFPDVQLPVTEGVAGRLLTLPLFPQMTHQQVDTVVAALAEAILEESHRLR